MGLLIVDIVIIIGIFVLQFRTDSSIIKKIGNLQITLMGTEEQEGLTVYKNKFKASYNGINFYCDDQNPAVIKKDEVQIPVQLIDWQQQDELSFIVKFTEGVKVTFELASNEPDASLAIMTELPSKVSSFMMPFNYSANMKLQKNASDSMILGTKKDSWELSAYSLEAGYSEFNRRDSIATYAVYNEEKKFTFDSIVNLAIASGVEYNKNIAQFKKNLISTFDSNTAVENITEQVAVSYIAALAENGNFNRALEKVPESVKKSRQRTYLSAPYLNTLEDMNANLEKTIKDNSNRIEDSLNSDNLEIFTIRKIADFIYIYPDKAKAVKLLQKVAQTKADTLSLAQIAGILQTYADLMELNPEYAAILEPVLKDCVEVITAACKFEGNILTISENDTFLSVIQAVETGISLLRYGTVTENDTLIKAGYALVNSYLSESLSFDLRTLANLYPIVSYDNPYYPHLEKIADNDKGLIWAWTCAKDISCTRTSEEISFSIDFPEGSTHYVIFKGVPQFNSIYIYEMAFRTDPRFETYNSSGYVYKKGSETLLLKSRHKQHFETVRLGYKENKPAPAPVVTPAPAAPAETTAESSPAPVPETPAPAAAAPETETSAF